MTQPRTQLTVEELIKGTHQPLIDMSFFAKPSWATPAHTVFSGTLQIKSGQLNFPKQKEYYPGENVFPDLNLSFISRKGELIPLQKGRISTRKQDKSLWDIFVGTGQVWHEQADGPWCRASFPLTLTDRWMGQARNCVATFVYQQDTVSQVCLQCSQETADTDDQQLGNIHGTLSARLISDPFTDSTEIIKQHLQYTSNRLPVFPLSEIDTKQEVADYFEQTKYTNAPTSLGAVLLNGKLYLHPPKTRHGAYPYPHEMRHGLYSVTKSMAGALVLLYFEKRYQENIFDALITDYVPALAKHQGWQGVTFSHTLNMVTGTVGGESADLLFSTLIVAETAEEAINNIAQLGDAPEAPGQKFNYASTNLFVLSYALQKLVEEKEGKYLNYWDLVRKNVLAPIGAQHFSVLHTMETEDSLAIPILAYGALPTIDEAAKIALLFANEGRYNGQQILDREKVTEIFDKSKWPGHSTNDDFRGSNYQHSFWSKEIQAGQCQTRATFMLGFGENYVVFLPSGAIIFRFLDEHDLNIDRLIKRVENIKSSCQ